MYAIRSYYDVGKADVQVARYPLQQIAVDVNLLDILDAIPQAFTQCHDALGLAGHFQPGDTEGFPHADDLMGRQGA